MVESSQPLILNSRFQLEKLIVRRHNNTIWRALDLRKKKPVAVKQITPVTYNAFIEERILKTMKDTVGFPDYYGTANQEDSCYLIMQLLSKDLERVFNSHRRAFTVDCVLKLGLHMFDRIQKLHARGYLHRDIKPAQFMLDSDSDVLYLLDFNLSSKITPSMGAITTELHTSYVGNATFSSINAHSTKHQSKRDDCEAVLHVLIYFLRHGLPWQKITYETDAEMWAKIKVCKLSTPVEDLCRDLPPEIGLCLSYCRGLTYTTDPNYDYIVRLLTTAHALSHPSRGLEKASTELNLHLSGGFLAAMKALLSETVGAMPSNEPARRVKKKRYPRMIDRSILQKVDDFVRESG
jgi:serine/threonine protein kinase